MSGPSILRDIPESFETDRLLLRCARPGDGAELNAAVNETRETLLRWMPWAKDSHANVDDSEAHCRREHARFLSRQDLMLHIYHKESGEFLGSTGLHPRDWSLPKFEIGYWCRAKFEGQGYTTEAVQGQLRFGFETLGAKRIDIRCDTTNERSMRIPERLGMIREGVLRNALAGTDGTARDMAVYAFTDADWRARHGR